MKRPALILLLAGALLSLLHWLAEPALERGRQAAAERALLDLLPSGSYDNLPLRQPIILPDSASLGHNGETHGYLASSAGRINAVLLPVTVRGYEGPIRLLVAISSDGQLLASKVLAQQETPGLANLDAPERQQWLRSLSQDPAVDQIAGATVTSRAVREALQRALRYFDEHRQALLGNTP